MANTLLKIETFGTCTRCMRAAFAATLGAGVLALGAIAAGLPGTVAYVLVAASLITALNLAAHVAGFAARNWRDAARPDPGRRAALAAIARTAAIGLAAAIPLATYSTAALAFCGQCTRDEDCGVGFVCRNTAAVNSGTVCNECVAA